jgi:hypothetical protein
VEEFFHLKNIALKSLNKGHKSWDLISCLYTKRYRFEIIFSQDFSQFHLVERTPKKKLFFPVIRFDMYPSFHVEAHLNTHFRFCISLNRDLLWQGRKKHDLGRCKGADQTGSA